MLTGPLLRPWIFSRPINSGQGDAVCSARIGSTTFGPYDEGAAPPCLGLQGAGGRSKRSSPIGLARDGGARPVYSLEVIG